MQPGLIKLTSHERLVSSFHTNFFGAVNLTRSLLPHLRSKQSGSLVYLGSMGAYTGEYAGIPYISTKGALESEYFRLERLALGGIERLTIFILIGFIDCVSKEVGFFKIK